MAHHNQMFNHDEERPNVVKPRAKRRKTGRKREREEYSSLLRDSVTDTTPDPFSNALSNSNSPFSFGHSFGNNSNSNYHTPSPDSRHSHSGHTFHSTNVGSGIDIGTGWTSNTNNTNNTNMNTNSSTTPSTGYFGTRLTDKTDYSIFSPKIDQKHASKLNKNALITPHTLDIDNEIEDFDMNQDALQIQTPQKKFNLFERAPMTATMTRKKEKAKEKQKQLQGRQDNFTTPVSTTFKKTYLRKLKEQYYQSLFDENNNNNNNNKNDNVEEKENTKQTSSGFLSGKNWESASPAKSQIRGIGNDSETPFSFGFKNSSMNAQRLDFGTGTGNDSKKNNNSNNSNKSNKNDNDNKDNTSDNVFGSFHSFGGFGNFGGFGSFGGFGGFGTVGDDGGGDDVNVTSSPSCKDNENIIDSGNNNNNNNNNDNDNDDNSNSMKRSTAIKKERFFLDILGISGLNRLLPLGKSGRIDNKTIGDWINFCFGNIMVQGLFNNNDFVYNVKNDCKTRKDFDFVFDVSGGGNQIIFDCNKLYNMMKQRCNGNSNSSRLDVNIDASCYLSGVLEYLVCLLCACVLVLLIILLQLCFFSLFLCVFYNKYRSVNIFWIIVE